MIAAAFQPSWTTFSLLVGRPEEKSKLTGLSFHQEASQKELEGVQKMAQRRTSPRRSGSSKSAVKIRSTSPGPTLKKALNEHGSIFNCLIFIEVFRELSKHTTYSYLSRTLGSSQRTHTHSYLSCTLGFSRRTHIQLPVPHTKLIKENTHTQQP
jgi:hypothetical protein